MEPSCQVYLLDICFIFWKRAHARNVVPALRVVVSFFVRFLLLTSLCCPFVPRQVEQHLPTHFFPFIVLFSCFLSHFLVVRFIPVQITRFRTDCEGK